jgi:hypothetical protein
VTFVTTEHFVLQGARSSMIAESTGRANMFLAAVSGDLVALGLVATASSVGTAFYAFALVLLPTLAFVGLVTFERVLQSGAEDEGYARRIALLRGYYFDNAPELAPYLLSVPPEDRLRVQGLPFAPWQEFRTVAGMVAVITAVLAGSTAALAAILWPAARRRRWAGRRSRRCSPRQDRGSQPPCTSARGRRSHPGWRPRPRSW